MSLNENYELVRQFHQTFSLPVSKKPAALSNERKFSRCDWLLEEVQELKNAKSIESQADALLDIIYLALGGFVELGTNPTKLFDIVHHANMSKISPDNRAQTSEDGKVVKPPCWEDPLPLLRQEVRRQLEI